MAQAMGARARTNRPLAYEMLPRIPDGDSIAYQHAVSFCKCGAEWNKIWRRPHHPIEIGKAAKRDGWEMDPESAGTTVCPACIEQRKIKRRGERPEKEKTMVAMVNGGGVALMPAPKGADNGQARALTVDERVAVRALLDGHFDDKAGRYLDSYSDQRVGFECTVPWASVAELREIAYGALKGNAELDTLRGELEQLEKKLAPIMSTAKNAVEKADQTMRSATAASTAAQEALDTAIRVAELHGNLKGRLDGVMKRLGVAP